MASFQSEQNRAVLEGKEVLVMSLMGQLDASAVPGLEKEVTALIDGGSRYLVFSLGGLEYVSSNGLGLVLAAHRRLEKEGGRVCLAEVPEDIAHIMQVLGFNRIIRTYPDVEAALQAAVSE